MTSEYDREAQQFNSSLYAVADGSFVRTLVEPNSASVTTFEAADSAGHSLVYMKLGEDGMHVRIVDVDGSNDRELGPGIGPTWQPCNSNGAARAQVFDQTGLNRGVLEPNE